MTLLQGHALQCTALFEGPRFGTLHRLLRPHRRDKAVGILRLARAWLLSQHESAMEGRNGVLWRQASRDEVLEGCVSDVEHGPAYSGALTNAFKGRNTANALVVATLVWAALMARWQALALALAAAAYGVG